MRKVFVFEVKGKSNEDFSIDREGRWYFRDLPIDLLEESSKDNTSSFSINLFLTVCDMQTEETELKEDLIRTLKRMAITWLTNSLEKSS